MVSGSKLLSNQHLSHLTLFVKNAHFILSSRATYILIEKTFLKTLKFQPLQAHSTMAVQVNVREVKILSYYNFLK